MTTLEPAPLPLASGLAPLRPWEYQNPRGQIVPCSWCQAEQHIPPQPGETHGICPRHLRAQLATIPEAKVAA